MEKLKVTYKDNSEMLVSNKRNGSTLHYFLDRVGYRPSILSAVIQRYPIKKYKPLVLIEDGARVRHDSYDIELAG